MMGALGAFALSGRGFGATPPTPPSPDPVYDPVGGLLGPAIVALVLVAVLILARRVPAARGGLAVAGLVLLFLAGGLSVAAGLFGDFSGYHRIFLVPLVIGVALMGAAVVGFWWLYRRGRRSAPASKRGV
jgi:hypothetical protein